MACIGTLQGAAAQDPDSAMTVLQELGLDSIQGPGSVTYSRPGDAGRAHELHGYHLALSAFSRDSLGLPVRTRLAVLRPDDWSVLSALPYGFPHNFGPPANLILAPASPGPASGVDTLLVGSARDLMWIAHEGGHLLSWSLMPPAMLDSIRVDEEQLSTELRDRFARFDSLPVWYWEFTATYLGIAFLRSGYPEAAEAATDYFGGLSSAGSPRVRSLDGWFEATPTSTTGDIPFGQTPEGSVSFGWYQGVVGIMADHVHGAGGLAYVSELRSLAAGTATGTTQELIQGMARFAPGLVATLDDLGVSWRAGP